MFEFEIVLFGIGIQLKIFCWDSYQKGFKLIEFNLSNKFWQHKRANHLVFNFEVGRCNYGLMPGNWEWYIDFNIIQFYWRKKWVKIKKKWLFFVLGASIALTVGIFVLYRYWDSIIKKLSLWF